MVELLLRRGYAFNRSADFDTVRQIKEQLCYVAYDYDRETRLANETTHLVTTYTLPHGRTIKVGAERFMAPEAMFKPDLIGIEGDGMAEVEDEGNHPFPRWPPRRSSTETPSSCPKAATASSARPMTSRRSSASSPARMSQENKFNSTRFLFLCTSGFLIGILCDPYILYSNWMCF